MANDAEPLSDFARAVLVRLQLDGGSFERLTTFNRWAPYYASNPAISPDGTTLAFQLSIDGEVEGRGDGILLMDLAG